MNRRLKLTGLARKMAGGKRIWFALLVSVFSMILCGCGSQRTYQEYLTRAETALEQGDYTAAVTACDEAAALFPSRADAFLLRADIYAAISAAAQRYSDDYSLAQRNAIADYAAALHLRADIQTRQKLIRLYFTAGDDALDMAREDLTVSAAAYQSAEEYYRLALSLDYANAEAYGRLADLYLARNDREQALEMLSRGVSSNGGETLTERLDTLRRDIALEDEQRRHAAAVETLSTPADDPSARRAYYGSASGCRMSAEQALAYAQLIADGLRGKFHGLTAYGKPVYDHPVYWDEPYAVMGYGSYETDRANVILGDFAGDGNPYLYVYSGLVDGSSFEIFGWDGTQTVRLAGVESYASREEGILSERADGTVLLGQTRQEGETSRSGEVQRFRNGSLETVQVWEETWDSEEQSIRVIRDGVSVTYTRSEWETVRRRENTTVQNHTASWASLEEVTAHPSTLRDMIACLNAYAAALSDGAAQSVEIPPEHDSRHRMATAMLHQLYVLEHLSIDADIRLRETRLSDFDGDGTEELLVVFDGSYHSQNGTYCQYTLYHWQDGVLTEIPGADELRELRLVRRSSTGEYGFCGIGTRSDPAVYTYTFVSGGEQLLASPSRGRFYTVRDGEPVGITESEYTALRGQYEDIETVMDDTHTGESWNYTQMISTLYQIRESSP